MLTLILYGILLGIGFWIAKKLTSVIDGFFLSKITEEGEVINLKIPTSPKDIKLGIQKARTGLGRLLDKAASAVRPKDKVKPNNEPATDAWAARDE